MNKKEQYPQLRFIKDWLVAIIILLLFGLAMLYLVLLVIHLLNGLAYTLVK